MSVIGLRGCKTKRFGEIESMQVAAKRDVLDVTTFGGAPSFVPGEQRVTVSIVKRCDAGVEMFQDDIGASVDLDETIGTFRLRGSFVVQSMDVSARGGGPLTATVELVSSGPVIMGQVDATAAIIRARIEQIRNRKRAVRRSK